MGACCTLDIPACIGKGPPGIRRQLRIDILGDRTAGTEGFQAGKLIVGIDEQFGDFAEISPTSVDAEVSPCGECGAGSCNGVIDIVDIGFVDCGCLARAFSSNILLIK